MFANKKAEMIKQNCNYLRYNKHKDYSKLHLPPLR